MISPGQMQNFMDSECVSCGACVQACPTATLMEKSVYDYGQPDRVVETTCAYCGVGCSFKAEVKGNQVVRMVPNKNGHANEGHSCVKGRFAFGYTTHPDRITKPMIRKSIDDPWKEVSWNEAIGYAASEFKRIQEKYGRDSIGGVTSSRCTNEETFLMQKLVRAAFGNNNVDTCARVCHSPDGYGLKTTLRHICGNAGLRLGRSGRCDPGHRRESDRRSSGVRFADEAASAPRREADRCSILARSIWFARRPYRSRLSPAAASGHERRADQWPGARRSSPKVWPTMTSSRERCDPAEYQAWKAFRLAAEILTGRRGDDHRRARGAICAAAARLYAPGRQLRDLLRTWRHRTQPGLDDGDGHGQPRDGHGQPRPRRRRRESAARSEQRAGLVRHGFVPA